MMKYFFGGLIILSVIIGFVRGDVSAVSNGIITSCGDAVALAITLCGIICLWSGIMRVAQTSGLTEVIAKILSPLLSKLFKGIDRNGRAMQYIVLNVTANLLGLGNASTPFGIAAMKELEKEEHSEAPEENTVSLKKSSVKKGSLKNNVQKNSPPKSGSFFPEDTATDNMILFTVLNTASLQLIPTTAAALRLQHGSSAPMEILPSVWAVSVVNLLLTVTAAKVLGRIYKRAKK